jgi:hypothetical protein
MRNSCSGIATRNVQSRAKAFLAILAMATLATAPLALRSRADGGKPEPPSTHLIRFRNDFLELGYPDNWRSKPSGSAFTLLPQGGAVQDAKGQSAIAYGVTFDTFQPRPDSNNHLTLEAAVDQLVASFRKGNPDMKETGDRKRMQVDGIAALSAYFTNGSPVGGNEKDWLVAIERPDGLAFFICVAPEKDFGTYDAAFQSVIQSVHFRQQAGM